ncbi:hypothetical protein F5Y18DRAFT_425518 [Xylariaceae sp. FL1019]|nr:hypothetical protein F5Y18DRAFT_425518 [Xylariaceae sp. FL1019]
MVLSPVGMNMFGAARHRHLSNVFNPKAFAWSDVKFTNNSIRLCFFCRPVLLVLLPRFIHPMLHLEVACKSQENLRKAYLTCFVPWNCSHNRLQLPALAREETIFNSVPMATPGIEYKDLLNEDGTLKNPIVNDADYEECMGLYLARNDQKDILPPPDLPASTQARQAERDELREAMTTFDPTITYTPNQSTGAIQPGQGRGEGRWFPSEYELKAFKLQGAIEDASQGKCKIPEMNEGKATTYQTFNGHKARFNAVRDILIRDKAAVKNVMSTDGWYIRLAWRPGVEEHRLIQNRKSAANKKAKIAAAEHPAGSQALNKDESVEDDKVVAEHPATPAVAPAVAHGPPATARGRPASARGRPAAARGRPAAARGPRKRQRLEAQGSTGRYFGPDQSAYGYIHPDYDMGPPQHAQPQPQHVRHQHGQSQPQLGQLQPGQIYPVQQQVYPVQQQVYPVQQQAYWMQQQSHQMTQQAGSQALSPQHLFQNDQHPRQGSNMGAQMDQWMPPLSQHPDIPLPEPEQEAILDPWLARDLDEPTHHYDEDQGI